LRRHLKERCKFVPDVPEMISGIAELDDLLSTPSAEAIEQFAGLEGDIIFLGVGGKIGPSLANMAMRATDQAGITRRIMGVSRFTDQSRRQYLETNGVETIAGDMLDRGFLDHLPDVENVFFLAAKKFGASAEPSFTWAMNVKLPALVSDRYRDSNIVAYSSGNVYPYVSVESGGCTEEHFADPVGEYAQTVLGRERMFEYGSSEHGTKVVMLRLNYAVEMRYGVLVDIGLKVKHGIPIDLRNGHVNVIWQGDNNSMTLRALDLCSKPPRILNITGPEILSVREIAKRFGRILGAEPVFENEESGVALLSNASKAFQLYGRPRISVDQMIQWISDWLRRDLPLLNKPTEFEVTDGRY
jgi:nucleoside-diphosphate-sugar epimerase